MNQTNCALKIYTPQSVLPEQPIRKQSRQEGRTDKVLDLITCIFCGIGITAVTAYLCFILRLA